MSKEFYIQEGSKKIAPEGVNVEFYVYEKDGKPCAQCFIGKQSKPTWHYRFANKDQLDAKIAEQTKSVKAAEELKAKNKADRLAKQNNSNVKIGDIYAASWGYDQTNVEFYQVVGKVGKTMLQIQEIAKEQVEGSDGFMSCNVVAVKDQFIGRAFKCKAGEYIKGKHSFSYASKWNGQPKYTSWYA